MTDPC
jgi:hypothetical protein